MGVLVGAIVGVGVGVELGRQQVVDESKQAKLPTPALKNPELHSIPRLPLIQYPPFSAQVAAAEDFSAKTEDSNIITGNITISNDKCFVKFLILINYCFY